MNEENIMESVLDASGLVSNISSLQKKIRNESTTSLQKPTPPIHKTATAEYPKIISKVKFSWVLALVPIAVVWVLASLIPVFGVLLLMASPAWIVVYYFLIYKPKKDEDIENIRKSVEYQQQCTTIDDNAKKQQEKYDKEFEEELRVYNEVTLPEYERNIKEQEKKQKQKIREYEKEIEKEQIELDKICDELGIPPKYRTKEALDCIYMSLSLSAESVEEAIDIYRENCNRQANATYETPSFRSVYSSTKNSSGGHGVLSGLAHSAMDNTKNRGTSSNSGGKQSLWGTAMCPWGQKAKKYRSSAPDFETIRCNSGCPMWTQCGGKK